MALETATFIDGLNASNPLGSDPISSADDHLRLIKSTIKATFPNINAAVTKTAAEINGLAPLESPTFTGTPTAPTASPGTNTTQVATTAFVAAALQAVYPVGSIYINAAVDTNPATLLGFGTWVAFGAGRVMVGQNTSDASFDVLEETGGSKDAIAVSHTHTASTNSTGAHQHYVMNNITQSNDGSISANETLNRADALGGNMNQYILSTSVSTANTALTSSAGDHSHTVTVNSAGSSGTNANLQPYIVVKMWKRTA
jgi:hypothetical protein